MRSPSTIPSTISETSEATSRPVRDAAARAERTTEPAIPEAADPHRATDASEPPPPASSFGQRHGLKVMAVVMAIMFATVIVAGSRADMAGAIGVAAVLAARLVKVTCPHCGHSKQVERRPAAHRVCPRCKRQFPDPIAARKQRR